MSPVQTRSSRWLLVGSTAVTAVALSLLLLFTLQSQAHALRFINGAFGCGDFATSVAQAPEGKTIIPMVPSRVSNGPTITRSVAIQGGWTYTDNNDGSCAGLGANGFITGVNGLRSVGFVFQAPITRSQLEYDTVPVLSISTTGKTVFIEHMDMRSDPFFDLPDNGAVLYALLDNSTLRLTNDVFRDGGADFNGGGVYVDVRNGSTLIIEDSFFNDNAAEEGGGMTIIVDSTSHVQIVNTEFNRNRTSLSNGGGGGAKLVINGGTVEIMNGRFVDNDAGAYGGGLYVQMNGGELIIRDSYFANNQVDTDGGGLYVDSTGSSSAHVTVCNTIFDNNDISPYTFIQSGSGMLDTFVCDHNVLLPSIVAAPTTDYAQITGITLNDNYQYVVDFETHGFTPQLPGQHVHFFFNTVPPSQAGMPGTGPWFVYGGSSPFTGYGDTHKPPFATEMCVLVANANHSVQPNSGNCFRLPVNK
jgi:hypothetical protein